MNVGVDSKFNGSRFWWVLKIMKKGLGPRTQILTKTFFCRLIYPWHNMKDNLACSGLVLGLTLINEVQVEQYSNIVQI